jgi:hypothetical protein
MTDTSSVASSSLLYASDAVGVTGETDIVIEPEGFRFPRRLGIDTKDGWSWLYCVVNGMSNYTGWGTTYPDWAVMSYKARGIYDY